MPTKTDRILGYLPGTFRALPRPTALYSVTDAFGNELQQAENTLVAVMRSHWVDFADQGDEITDDLARIASLYGLAPRDDEEVEDFRAHLKHYVRTFLEGTPTVQGILRVAAEALALPIVDDYNQIDTWWTRKSDALVAVEPRGDDARTLLFGRVLDAQGSAAAPARISGATDLSGGVDLTGTTKLTLRVDALPPVAVDFSSFPNLAAVVVSDVIRVINGKFTMIVADCPDGKHLVLSSPTVGVASKVSVQDVAGDAAPKLLGLAPRMYSGSTEDSAQVTGTVDLASTLDLSERRYLRLQIDGANLAELDCAGARAAATTPAEIVTAINNALGLTVASFAGSRLVLTSPTTGFTSTIQFQSPAAQDATQLLFGDLTGIYAGHGPQPAIARGVRDLSAGVDLSQNHNIEISVDGGAHLHINCAGANHALSTSVEIIRAINLAAGKSIASQNGKFVTLTSPTVGAGSSLQFFTPASSDATFDIFGIPPREVVGWPASAAKLTGLDVPSDKLDLRAQHLLQIGLDGGGPITIDFWKTISDRKEASISTIADSINAAAGVTIAAVEGPHLALTSATQGVASAVSVEPVERTVSRRFVSRAFVSDEASQKVLGVYQKQAIGKPAEAARLEGAVDLGRGVDLREQPFLKLSIDGSPAQLIDCSSTAARPRVCLPDEIVQAINKAVTKPGDQNVASHDGHHLVLTSPSVGAGSSIEFQSVLATDASAVFGLTPATVFGHDATRVVFRGVVNISSSLDLSTASKIKLAVDGGAPLEIDCAGPDPAQTSVGQIVTRINTALSAVVAALVGNTISLVSPTTGASSKIEILAPNSSDATKAIFGVTPRAYHGQDAIPPQIRGSKDISAGVDLQSAKFLQLGSNGVAFQAIDCSAGAAKSSSVKLPEIVNAINQATKKTIASSPDGKHLVLTAPITGASGKIVLENFVSDGAFTRLFGDVPRLTSGVDPVPAVITGTVDLLAGVDLSERRILRLAVHGSRPADIDISGVAPATTFLNDIVDRINTVFPGVASASSDDHLVLTSSSGGESSSLEILPIRVLDLLEYPAMPANQTQSVRHGSRFSINNIGPADSELQFEIAAPQGVAGVELVNRASGLRVRVLDAVPAGGILRVHADEEFGLVAEILNAAGVRSLVRGSSILAGPLGRQVWVPYSGLWRLGGGGSDTWAALQLNNPQAQGITIVRARRRGLQGGHIGVSVSPASLPTPVLAATDGNHATLTGKLQLQGDVFRLLDAANAILAVLRAGPGVSLGWYVDQVVVVEGKYYSDSATPLLVVEFASLLFDVTVQGAADDGSDLVESYAGVTIGTGAESRSSLTRQILAKPSQLVVSDEFGKVSVLRLSGGRSDWSYLTSAGARFNQATFNHSIFAGGKCLEEGVFNASLFACAPKPPQTPPKEPEVPVFAGDPVDPPSQITLQWTEHRPGAFVVNLPADLPEKFGARFNQARFARAGDAPEVYAGVVIEPAKEPPGAKPGDPPSDPEWMVNQINKTSTLVKADRVDRVPMGWDSMPAPFYHPRARALTGGTDNDQAAIYLSESGVPGFIELKAIEAGTWGNTIEVTVRKAGPARFDVTIGYEGARFENARQTVFAGRILAPGEDPLPALTGEILKPRPVGVLQGKAAGVLAQVTRSN